jgi:pectate lyase
MAGEQPDTTISADCRLIVTRRTKGGAGGPTTSVSTLPQLSAAANSTGALNIVVQGAISGAAKVQVGSDKTIVGKAGSCMSCTSTVI